MHGLLNVKICNVHLLGIVRELKYDNGRYGKLYGFSYHVCVALPYCGEFSQELAQTVEPSNCIPLF